MIFLNQNTVQIFAGSYLGLLASFFLIWFAGVLRESLRRFEGETGRLSNMAFGGGVATAVLLIVAFATSASGASRASADSGISVQSAVLLHDLWSTLMGNAVPFVLTVLVAACSVTAIRTALFPNWFGWLSALLAIGLLSPVSYVFITFGMVWLLVVSFWLYANARPDDAKEMGLEAV